MLKRSPLAAYLAILAATVIITAIVLSLARTPGLYGVARGAALVGYQFVFLAVLSSAFTRQLVRAYRKPFIRLHHWVSITGLALLVLHPILLVIVLKSTAVLTAAYTSGEFFRYAGSPALIAFFLAAIAAVLRTRMNTVWRYIHWLNYVALLLGTAHAVLLGTSVALLPWLRWVLVLLAACGVAVYISRRVNTRAAAR